MKILVRIGRGNKVIISSKVCFPCYPQKPSAHVLCKRVTNEQDLTGDFLNLDNLVEKVDTASSPSSSSEDSADIRGFFFRPKRKRISKWDTCYAM